MRILFTIPHYYDAKGGGNYGSLKSNAAPRRAALLGTLFTLHSTFGRRQGLLGHGQKDSNSALSADIEIVVCTVGERHLLGGLRLPAGLMRQHKTGAESMYLGYECHDILRRQLGRFDYYCYLEDDIAVLDPLFFRKLDWFSRLAGDEALLQPNRNEVGATQRWYKLYIDGDLTKPEWSERWQDTQDRNEIVGEAFGAPVRFIRVNNPHSGCFFLNARQMAHWAKQPDFLTRENCFVGPLESAATLGVMRHFRVYKPARANAGFLEVRHLDNRYLGARLAKKPAPRTPA
jgi:hypothetical protein